MIRVCERRFREQLSELHFSFNKCLLSMTNCRMKLSVVPLDVLLTEQVSFRYQFLKHCVLLLSLWFIFIIFFLSLRICVDREETYNIR